MIIFEIKIFLLKKKNNNNITIILAVGCYTILQHTFIQMKMVMHSLIYYTHTRPFLRQI